MRILLITPYYFPYINPRAHRWTSIAEEWAKQGHEVHVICSKRNKLPIHSIANKVHIHRTGYNSLKEVFYNFFKSKKRRGEAQEENKEGLKRSYLMTFLVWFNETFWKSIYFPDDACVWYFPAKKKTTQLLQQHQFDYLITVSLPFTAHLIGQFCKKKNPEIKWLVDIGDPFSLQFDHPLNNHFFYKSLNIQLEKKVLEKADKISVTTHGTKQLFIDKFELPSDKISVIPPLLKSSEGDLALPPHLRIQNNSNQIHIGYFGSFFKNIREPEPFLELLKMAFLLEPSLKGILVVHFFGDIIEHFLKTFERYKDLKPNLRLYGLIQKELVHGVMNEMDFLLNISNKTAYQLPSKSVDYLASGKPIINICSIEHDLFNAFFEDYPFILNLLFLEKSISKKQTNSFLEFLNKNKGEKIEGNVLKDKIKRYEAPQISKAYTKVLLS